MNRIGIRNANSGSGHTAAPPARTDSNDDRKPDSFVSGIKCDRIMARDRDLFRRLANV